ncbi:PhzF family phenazine biosynthesis protein [Aquisphaera insulae]|uniref:PhzF family phenazine biosynthesis protein n=1 Tax=Aquisphaera insulae TaxID=2712864 RepID=UPI0013EA99C3|nr:PhzF family phenazine biosynthesis protein [Aquisphaera insulae]
MKTPIIQVDAFSARPFAGNPAAVCLLDGPADEIRMQHIAAEMNLSETAFVYREAGSGIFRLRWFTPVAEVDLCGHATLATAHALWEGGILDRSDPCLFDTRSGRLEAKREGDWIALDFPSEPCGDEIVDATELDSIRQALGASVQWAGRNRLDLLIELEDERAVRELSPDHRRVARIPVRGVIVTARSADPAFDFVSRFFAPALGIDEDPVCGSAHCCLGPFWAARIGLDDLTGHQVSRRGGVVRTRVRGARTHLLGQAVTVLKGHLVE